MSLLNFDSYFECLKWHIVLWNLHQGWRLSLKWSHYNIVIAQINYLRLGLIAFTPKLREQIMFQYTHVQKKSFQLMLLSITIYLYLSDVLTGSINQSQLSFSIITILVIYFLIKQMMI